MKRDVIDVKTVGVGLADKQTIEKRRYQQELRKKLGLLVPYDSNFTRNNSTGRFSKYYETQADYDRDKAIADVLIIDEEQIPEDLYNRLIETNLELKSQ